MVEKITLTREQRERDYEFLWQVLNECFPLRGPMARMGYDWNAIKEECRLGVLDAKDDLEYCRGLNQVFKKLNNFAHLMLFNGRMYRMFQNTYKAFADGAYEDMDHDAFAPWMEAVHHPKSELIYERLDDSDAAGREFFWKDEPHESEPPDKYTSKPGPAATCLMLPGSVVYLKIPTFNMLKIAEDRPILFDFYAKYKGCKDLIIDIRGNGGGATDYWNKLLVAPVIKEAVPSANYMLFAKGPLNEMYINASLRENGEMKSDNLRPINELPEFPNFHPEYLSQATHFVKAEDTTKPDPEHHFEVERVWLLTDKVVYSSAEAFAVFCRGCKWATIIGERTGGDGVGITPFHAILPESGLLMRYSGELGLNSDGGSNAEYHTIPDMECDPADALMVCLAHIADLNKGASSC